MHGRHGQYLTPEKKMGKKNVLSNNIKVRMKYFTKNV
jgi:hypothetical protein